MKPLSASNCIDNKLNFPLFIESLEFHYLKINKCGNQMRLDLYFQCRRLFVHALRKINYTCVLCTCGCFGLFVCVFVCGWVSIRANMAISNQYVNYKCDTLVLSTLFLSIDSGAWFFLRHWQVSRTEGQSMLICTSWSFDTRTKSRHLESFKIKPIWCHVHHYVLYLVIRSVDVVYSRLESLLRIVGYTAIHIHLRQTVISRYLFID